MTLRKMCCVMVSGLSTQHELLWNNHDPYTTNVKVARF